MTLLLQKTENAVGAGDRSDYRAHHERAFRLRYDERLKMHWQRILRSVMHGFIAHKQLGGFSHFPIDKDQSYHLAIQVIADSLRNAGKEHHANR